MPSSTELVPSAPTIAAEKYVWLTTFTKRGDPNLLPVWLAALPDGRVGFTTLPDSWTVTRLSKTPRVTLRPCDQRGEVADGAIEVSGTAVVVDGAQLTAVQSLIKPSTTSGCRSSKP